MRLGLLGVSGDLVESLVSFVATLLAEQLVYILTTLLDSCGSIYKGVLVRDLFIVVCYFGYFSLCDP